MSANKILKGATEALEVSRGESPAAAIWHNGVRYVPEMAAQPVEGWRDLEVTDAMTDAGAEAAEGWFEIDGDKGAWLRSHGYAAAFKAMLAAAPASPVAGGERREVLEKAAHCAYVVCAKTRHVSLGNEVADAIRALAATGDKP